MIKAFLKTAVLAITKQASYSLINIIGLALGIASFIIIALYIQDELAYDKYHQKADNIYRLVSVYDFEGVGENAASAPFPVAEALLNDYPGIVRKAVRLFNFQAPTVLIQQGEKRFNEKEMFFVDSSFFEVFDHEFIRGNAQTALDLTNSTVITESYAKKYFGNEDPMGKFLRYEDSLNLQVTGIIKDVPEQSHFNFDIVASLATLNPIFGGRLPQTWVWNPCWTYLVLEEGSKDLLESSFPGFIDRYFYDAEKEHITLYLQPLLDIHLNSKLDYEIEANNNITHIYILAAIAFFLLIIACINFMNLTTATSARRAKEIGIRKVIGGYRFQIVVQFLSESVVMALLSMFFALIIVAIVLPAFNTFTGKSTLFTLLLQPQSIISILLLGLITGLFAGIYPAIFLSSFQPAKVLKGSLKAGVKGGLIRKLLVVIQFSISISLIIGTLVVFKQIKFMQAADVGFTKENIIVLPVRNTPIDYRFKAFKNELLLNPNILAVTAVDDILGVGHNTHEYRPEGYPEDKWQFYPALVVMHDFVKTVGMRILAGRDYSKENKTDEMKGILINEAMVKHLGWASNEEALGKKFKSLNGDERVIGVFNNFNATSLHESSGAFVLNMKENEREIGFFLNYLYARIAPGKEKEGLAFIEQKWLEFAPNRPFEYTFLDEELKKSYKADENLGSLSLVFTVLIIVIAAMGLLGLASYMTSQRTKEIGIRKVLGAETFSIIRLISKEFVVLILIAVLISWTASYFLLNKWLQQFAYRTNIDFWIFLLAGFIALFVALAISCCKTLQLSRLKVIDSLKYE